MMTQSKAGRFTMGFAVLAVLLIPGCATTIQDGPGQDRWQFDLMACERENYPFTFIPDGGITFEIRLGKCMRAKHWARSGRFTWTWTGGATPPGPSWD